MKTCAATNCFNPVFGKNFCRNHQHLRADFDKRSAAQKYADKIKNGNVDKAKVIDKIDEYLDESLQNLILDADAIFSRYVRLKYSNAEGMVKCFTCPKVLPISQIQNGHYISRGNIGLRHMIDNCRPQCPQCNARHEEDTEPFRNALEAERKGIVEYLEEEARLVAKPTRSELKGIIADHREKVKILELKIKK
jgi:hypothetical protein